MDAIVDKITRWIGAPESDTETSFDELAIELFHYQFAHNMAYQNYCRALGIDTAEQISSWRDIPAVTTDVFKLAAHNPSSVDITSCNHVFHTSGTTGESYGCHYFPSLDIYESSILSAWHELDQPAISQPLIFTKNHSLSPHSSLVHMFECLRRKFAADTTDSIYLIDDDGQLDVDAVRRAAASDKPVSLLGTALAFLHLFQLMEKSGDSFTLPAGSWALETGGYKGSQFSLSKEELYALFAEKLGLQPDQLVNEYSMTELSSQFYTRGIGNAHCGPRWTRTRVIDPNTGAEVAQGELGYLVIYDLANVHSVSAIRPQDLAISCGENQFILIGRDPSALPRGCSRSAQESLQAAK